MMLPAFKEGRGKRKQMILDFKGINLSDAFSDGEMEDSEGISLSEYPSITDGRHARREGEWENVSSIFGRGGLAVCEEGKFYFDGEYIGDVSVAEKSFCGINTKIVFFPDKGYFDTKNKKLGSLENNLSSTGIFTAGGIALDSTPEGFAAGDAVEISGSSAEENNKSAIIREISGNLLIFDGDTFTETEESENLKIERSMPTFSLICEHHNRVWGVKDNIIYASKLGDSTNFNVFDGLSTDSYSVAVASPGEFTAVIGYGNKILFFKEEYIHVLYGTKPSNYQLYTYNVPGVKAGCSKSVQIIDEVLYYQGRDGIYAYTSGVPQLISEELGRGEMSGGVSGKDGSVYFICVKREEGSVLYSYDTKRGFWLKETKEEITDFATVGERLLYVSGKRLYSFCHDSGEKKKWHIEFKPFTEYLDERKIYSRLFMRYELSKGSVMRVFVSCDGEPFYEAALLWGDEKRCIIPIVPKRCDSFRVKIEGRGGFKIKSLTREFTVGSVV